MIAYYNEHDKEKCKALLALMADGHIPKGDIDDRDIRKVSADDVKGYGQQHFFAGIGGWAIALKLAGWPADRSVCTGSCPCPPWSNASIIWNRQGQEEDERDLWPFWSTLISGQPIIFGEQVASKAALRWYDRLADDLEEKNYTVRAADLPALCTGSPQRRHRIFFAADNRSEGTQRLEPSKRLIALRSRRWRGQEDLQAIATRPFGKSDMWPQPLIRSGDDGTVGRRGALHSAGDAIDVVTAAEFILATTGEQINE